MKNNSLISWSLLCFILFSCHSKPTDGMPSYEEEAKLMQLVKEKGDTKAYMKLDMYWGNTYEFEKALEYSLLMADKYHYYQAYYGVYLYYVDVKLGHTGENPSDRLDKLTKNDRNYALSYLIKAWKAGEGNSKYELERLFKENRYITKNEKGEYIIKEDEK